LSRRFDNTFSEGQAELSQKTVGEVKTTATHTYITGDHEARSFPRHQRAFCATILASDELTRLEHPLIRRLVVLKLWQARDTFDPARLMQKFEHGAEFDWDDLRDLIQRDAKIDRERICGDCVRGFRFLADLTPEERTLANDPHQWEQALSERLGEGLQAR